MLGRRRAFSLLGVAAALSATRVEAARRRPRGAAASASVWVVRLGGWADTVYAIDFRRGEMGAPVGAFTRQRGIRLVGSCVGQVTVTGVGAPHVVVSEAFDLALECAGILVVAGGPTRWLFETRVSLGGA